MTVLTVAVTLVLVAVMLVTLSFMRKNGSEVPGQGAVGASWKQGSWDERSINVYFLASPSHLWWNGSWTGHCRSELEVGRLSAVCQRSSYSFPSNKFGNVWACTHYEKYLSGIDRTLKALSLGRYHNSFLIVPVARTCPYISKYLMYALVIWQNRGNVVWSNIHFAETLLTHSTC